MRKLIFAINMTINGEADHNTVIADEELHDFHTQLLDTVDLILFGRKTYQLLADFWPSARDYPEVTQDMLKFADKINPLPKIVFSKTLEKAEWNTTIVRSDAVEEVKKLKQQPGLAISVGGLSLASELSKHGLIDEFWFLIQPMTASTGKRIWYNLDNRINLELRDSRTFKSGVSALHYTLIPGVH